VNERTVRVIKWTLIGLSLFALLTAILYGYVQYKDIAFNWKKYFGWFGIITLVGLVAGGLIYYFFFRTKQKEALPTEFAKEIVPPTRALQIWTEEFIKASDIASITQYWNLDDDGNPRIVPARDDAVEIRNENSFVDPTQQTSDKFMSFEAIVREGSRVGTLVAVIRVDLGEDWIRKSWNWRLRDHRSHNRFDLQNNKFPLTGSKDAVERFMMRRIELASEGYSEQDLRETFDPLIRNMSDRRPDSLYAERNPPIRAEELSTVVPEYTRGEDPVEADQLQDDIKAWQGRKSR
jgi:hypothetical protein